MRPRLRQSKVAAFVVLGKIVLGLALLPFGVNGRVARDCFGGVVFAPVGGSAALSIPSGKLCCVWKLK